MGENIFIVAVVVIGLLLLVAFIYGSIDLFVFAGQQGFIGLAAFVACWVFFWQILTVISVLIGLTYLYKASDFTIF